MFFVLSVVICYGFLSHKFSSAKQCDPANHICSGRCPDVPPEIELPNDVAICMKDSKTQACVCWLKSDTSHSNSLFLCEAFINGSNTQLFCRLPSECFPADSEPTCVVIPFCDCTLMKDSSTSVLEFGNWKPVKAIIEANQNSEKYPSHVREFSLKHLLFLLGFVIAPLLCWCFLNFVNEKKCRRKRVHCPETQPMNVNRRDDQRSPPDPIENVVQPVLSTTNSHNSSILITSTQPVVNQRDEMAGRRNSNNCLQDVTSSLQKNESPPSYYEACLQTHDDEDSLPPSYEESMRGGEGNTQQAGQVLIMNSRTCDNV